MFDPYTIIDTILVTEKSMQQQEEENKYTFKVNKKANKIEVAKAVEAIYNVKVDDVNIQNRPGKPKRMGMRSLSKGKTASTKRAIVTLKEGSIELM